MKKFLRCGCSGHVPVCLNCGRECCPRELFNASYCPSCYNRLCVGERMAGSRRCVVPGCTNRTDEGGFRGEFCSPCFNYIVRGGGSSRNPSQAYRNELVKANLRELSAMRRI